MGYLSPTLQHSNTPTLQMSHATALDVGKQVRLDRIMNPETGNIVAVPMDHGIIMGPVQGMANIGETIDRVVAGGADSVIFNAGMARNLYPHYSNRCGRRTSNWAIASDAPGNSRQTPRPRAAHALSLGIKLPGR